MRVLTLSRTLLVGGLCAFAGCGGCDERVGVVDAAVRDAQVDAATPDTGVDAPVRDAQVDAAGPDTLVLDAQVDAAGPDSGVDAAARDAQIDAATSDAGGGTEDDSGVDPVVPDDCSGPVSCPSAAADKVTVCGRLYDVETDTELRAAAPTLASCGSGAEATDGPCQLAIRFYDALDFAGNPTSATPLAVQAFQIDDCGRYVAQNVDLPALGFLGVVVDDAAAAPDDHRLTAVAFAVSSGQVRDDQRSYVVSKSTDAKWSTDVGLGATTFVDRGVLMSIFYQGTAPAAGVTVTANGAVRASDDYYFTDTDAKLRYSVTATGPTQANGAALLLNSSLVEHSGQGAEPSGCVWPSHFGISVPGVLWVLPLIAELSTGGECP